MQYLVSELFDKIEKANTKDEKIALLRQNGSNIVKAVLHMNYDGTVKWLLPEGEPPFKKEKDRPIGYQQTTLNLELRRFYVWFQQNSGLSQVKKEQLFIDMLNGLHWTEAELICLAKDKKVHTKYPSLTLDLVKEAYPDIVYAEEYVFVEAPPPKKTSKKRSKKSLDSDLQLQT